MMLRKHVLGQLVYFSAVLLFTNCNEHRFTGDGVHISWEDSLIRGLEKSWAADKKLMLIICPTWCVLCPDLKLNLVQSDEVQNLKDELIIVYKEDDFETTDPKYHPDGVYYPTVLFLDTKGNVLTNIHNPAERSENDKYYYYYVDEIVESMKVAIGPDHIFGPGGPNESDDTTDSGVTSDSDVATDSGVTAEPGTGNKNLPEVFNLLVKSLEDKIDAGTADEEEKDIYNRIRQIKDTDSGDPNTQKRIRYLKAKLSHSNEETLLGG